jgi:hypothetical protein
MIADHLPATTPAREGWEHEADQLAPSLIAKKRQEDKKRANDYRRMTAFQR